MIAKGNLVYRYPSPRHYDKPYPKELTAEDIATIADTFHAWRSSESELKRRIAAKEIGIEQYQR